MPTTVFLFLSSPRGRSTGDKRAVHEARTQPEPCVPEGLADALNKGDSDRTKREKETFFLSSQTGPPSCLLSQITWQHRPFPRKLWITDPENCLSPKGVLKTPVFLSVLLSRGIPFKQPHVSIQPSELCRGGELTSHHLENRCLSLHVT